MSNFATAPAIMSGLGLFFGVVLAVAYRFLRVDEDPRIAATEALLPGTNCGACGEPGCGAFAQRLVAAEVQPGDCTVADGDTLDALAELLGVEAGEQRRRIARLHCAGGRREAFQIAEYAGFDSCRAAAVVSGGGKGCAWGCLGLADCARACSFDAITMNGNGLPRVMPARCTACGDCVDACPKGLFEILPVEQHLVVQCRNPLAGSLVTRLCSVGCDACGRCAVDATPGLIRLHENLPQVDFASGLAERPKAAARCPTGAIRWLDGGQFADLAQGAADG